MTDPKQKAYAKLILTGVISLAVGVGAPLLLDLFRSAKPKLEYAIVASSVFSGPSQNIAILSVEVTQSGQKEAEDVTVTIGWENAQYKESKVVGLPPDKYRENATPVMYQLEVPFINPGEKLRADLLLTLAAPSLSTPKVDVRAKGLVGKPVGVPRPEKRDVLLTTLAAASTLLTALIAMWFRWRRRRGLGPASAETLSFGDYLARASVDIPSGLSGSGNADQRDVVASILDLHGLHCEG